MGMTASNWIKNSPMVLVIHESLQKQKISGKGYGYIAKSSIPRGTIVIRETPDHELDLTQPIFSDIFQLLYLILNDKDEKSKQKFMSLTPLEDDLEIFRHFKKQLSEEMWKLKSLSKDSKKVYQFFKNTYQDDEILMFAAKYISNAFSFGQDGPVMLYTGYSHSISHLVQC